MGTQSIDFKKKHPFRA